VETSPPQSKTDHDREKVYNAGTRGLTPPVVIYSSSSYTDPSNTSTGNPGKKKSKVETVLVEFTVDASGKVANVKVRRASDGHFANEAERAVRTWRFKPATFKGKHVACRLAAELKFHESDGRTKH
jgi:TonB family protein